MPIRVRHPTGSATLAVDPSTTTLRELKHAIQALAALPPSRQALRIGFPPKPLPEGTDEGTVIESLGIRNGDTVVVAQVEPPPPPAPSRVQPEPPRRGPVRQETTRTEGGGPECIPFDQGWLVHRVVADDNSCLFTSLALLLLPGVPLSDGANSLRSLVAELLVLPQYREKFPDEILGQSRESYIKAIVRPTTWGGAIELALLSAHFNVAIHSLDVQSGRVDTFASSPDEPERGGRVFVVYSGIHYDALTLSPLPPPHSTSLDIPFDTLQFPLSYSPTEEHDPLLAAALTLAAALRKKHAYTDAANFTLRCEDCGAGVRGEKEAREHAKVTGHARFGEY